MTGDVITPSSIWQGYPAEGSRWTVGQLETLRQAGVANPETVATATISRRPKVNAEDWTRPPAPVLTVVPRLAVTRDGRRAKIITPAGATRWMDVAHG